MFVQKKCSRKLSGESLLEVLIAVVILVVFMTSILTIVNRAMFMNENIRMRVMGLSLAREGMEGMRNIRDTNWLRFSGDMRNKWLCNSADCTVNFADLTIETSYTIDFKNNAYVLVEEDIVIPLASKNYDDYVLYQDTDGKYTHDSSGTETKFHRQIKLELLPTACPPPIYPITECPKKLKVISRVWWQEENGEKEVTLEAHLYDYYKRNDY